MQRLSQILDPAQGLWKNWGKDRGTWRGYGLSIKTKKSQLTWTLGGSQILNQLKSIKVLGLGPLHRCAAWSSSRCTNNWSGRLLTLLPTCGSLLGCPVWPQWMKIYLILQLLEVPEWVGSCQGFSSFQEEKGSEGRVM